MILQASDYLFNYSKSIIDLRKKCVKDVAKWVSLRPDTLLSELMCFERLYIKFDEYDKSYKLPGRRQLCYKYAVQACAFRDNLIYCEGLAVNKNCSSVPLEHAWCLDVTTGKVVDPTWKNKHQGIGYCGIPFNFNFVKDVMLQTQFYGVLPHLHMVYDAVSNESLCNVVHATYLDKILKGYENS